MRAGQQSARRNAVRQINRRCLREGTSAGVAVIDLDNGRLKIAVCPTRGMGILEVQAGGMRFGWDSPAGFAVHPKSVNLARANGNGWLDGFTEMVVRCGLHSIGRAGWDRDPFRGTRERLTLHGRIANLPAESVQVRRRLGKLEAIARVVEDDLVLETRITTAFGSHSFRIDDVVINRGVASAEFQLLYHSNFGRPLLAAGARFLAPVDFFAGMNDSASRTLRSMAEFGSPTRHFRERVYLVSLRSDRRGGTCVALENAAQRCAVSLRFNVRELPCMTLWKQTGAAPEMYVTGLEPGTAYPQHRSVERRDGRTIVLRPGESHRASVEYAFHLGVTAVARLRREIALRQGAAAPVALPRSEFFRRVRRTSAADFRVHDGSE